MTTGCYSQQKSSQIQVDTGSSKQLSDGEQTLLFPSHGHGYRAYIGASKVGEVKVISEPVTGEEGLEAGDEVEVRDGGVTLYSLIQGLSCLDTSPSNRVVLTLSVLVEW